MSDKIDHFLQNFPYQICLVARANVAPATVSSIYYVKFFLMPIHQHFSCQKHLLYKVYAFYLDFIPFIITIISVFGLMCVIANDIVYAPVYVSTG